MSNVLTDELPTTATGPTKTERGDQFLSLGVLGLPWVLLFNELRMVWSVNPQYSYGWSVPLLALGLFWRRWVIRPQPAPGRVGWMLKLTVVPLLLAWLPLRLILEANLIWQSALWAHALVVLALSLSALFYLGGWPWVKHLAFPVFFALVSVPWPYRIEQALVQNLMRFVAAVTVEVVGFVGIPALQHGNLIEIGSGVVGIDEACSGVRSLQSTFMVALFLGELYQFTVKRRAVLLGAGFLTAILGNLGRTFFLVWTAAHHGFANLEQYHNTAGTIVMLTALGGVWAIALLLRQKPRPISAASDSDAHAPSATQVPPPALAASAALPSPGDSSPPHPAPRFFPRWLLGAVGLWILLCETGVEAWYRAHEAKLQDNVRWSIAWPVANPGFGEVPLTAQTRELLQFDEGRGARWLDEIGHQWVLYHFRWQPSKKALLLAQGHTPDVCIKAAGGKLREDLGVRVLLVGDLEIPVSQFVFEGQRGAYHVFHCLWEDRSAQDQRLFREDGTLRSKFHNVRHGRRPGRKLGQQVIEIMLSGPATPDEAAAVIGRELARLIHKSEP